MEIDPHTQIGRAAACADVGDVTCPKFVRCCWVELLLEQDLRLPVGIGSTVAARAETAPGFGLVCSQAHEPGDAVLATKRSVALSS